MVRLRELLSRLSEMPTFVYRCPNTSLKVQGVVADEATDDDTFHPVTCIACTRIHMVNPKTAKVLGGDDEE